MFISAAGDGIDQLLKLGTHLLPREAFILSCSDLLIT